LDAHLTSVVWFGVGVVLQAVLTIRIDRTWTWMDGGLLGVCVTVSAALTFNHPADASPQDVLECMGFFGVLLAVFFDKRILPVVNEKIVLSYTIVFWYALYVNFQRLGLPDWLVYALLVPTSAALIIAFTQPALTFFWKVAMYAWFLSLVLSLGLFQFSFARLAIFNSPKADLWLTPIECLTTGMAFLYLCINATFLFELIPLPGRNQSWKDRMREWHALTELMAYRFSDRAIPSVVAGTIFVVEGGVLALNYIYHFISDGLLINLLVVLPGLLYFGSRVAPPVPASDKGA
jgi:hypothetical protein